MEGMIAFLAFAFALQQPPDFELTYLTVHGRRQNTVVQDFDGDGLPDLLNTVIDFRVEPPVRWFLLHRQTADRTFHRQPDFVWKVGDRAAALLFGDFHPGGGVEIGFVAVDGVYTYAWKEDRILETPRKLLHVPTFFSEASGHAIPLWMRPRDLDGNGLHDILLPVAGGYRVYFQTQAGIFGSISELEADLRNRGNRALPTTRFAASHEFVAAFLGSTIQVPRLGVTDVDGDKRLDLVSIDGDLLTVFFQKKPRVYSSRRGWRVRFPVATLREEEKKDTVNVSLVSFTDINGDGLADLAVTKIEGMLGFMDSIKTSIFIHRGTGRGNFVADSVLKIDGVSVDPMFTDMNGDGAKDCLVSRFRTDILAQAVKALILGDVAVTYEVFQFQPRTGRFIDVPVYAYDVFVTTDDIKKKGVASAPMVFIVGDHSGDGRADMVYINPKTTELELRRGVDWYTGSRRTIDFQKHAFWKAKLGAGHPKRVRIQDVNGDGTNDVMLLHRGTLGLVLSKKK